jgi:diguanylate cyclase (GGDEF)-like protein
MHTQTLSTHYDGGLICLSVAIAVIASYGALDLAQRSRESAGSRKRLWIGGAGITMGLGIWSMHFVGMLSLRMDMPVSYNGLLVVLSLVAAVGGASVALAVVARPQVSRRGVLSASAFMGLAIAAMHFLGMASMQMAAVIDWNIPLVVLSLAIAFFASLFALWLIVQIGVRSDGLGFGRRVVAAVLLGIGVAGLHYTAMEASSFRVVSGATGADHGLDTGSLVVMLAIGAGVMLAVLIGGAGVDQRRAALAKDLSLVADLARQLARIGGAREHVCETIKQLAAADSVVLIELSVDHALSVTASAGETSAAERSRLIEHQHVAAGLQSGEPQFIGDLHGRSPSRAEAIAAGPSVLFEPLSLDSRPVGVLVVIWRDRLRHLPERTSTLLSMLAAEAAVAINRETLLSQLEYMSRRDELTGLLNRRVLGEELGRQLATADRHDRPLSIVMLDLDHFKAYNDTHGHQAGDRLLRTAAAAWTAALRRVDTIARYGGEEFVAILPDCGLEAAIATADRLRAAVPVGATCSAGVAVLEERFSAAELIRRADQALYAAKRAGRDRTRADRLLAGGVRPALTH